MDISTTKANRAVQFFTQNILSVLLSTVTVSAIINVYESSIVFWLMTAFLLVYNLLIFIIFDVLDKYRKRSKTLPALVIILMFVAVLVVSVQLFRSDSSVSVFNWFFATSDTERSMPQFTLGCTLLFGFFASSVNFYFTRIIYRSLFLFLANIVPLVLYGKTFTQVPAIFPVLIILLYFLVMVHCRQTNFSKEKIVANKSYYISVIAFIAAVSIGATFLPKLEKTPYREDFDQLITGTDFKLFSLNGVSNYVDTASSNTGDNSQSNQLLYTVYSDSNVYLRRQVFDIWDGNRWGCIDDELYLQGWKGWEKSKEKQSYIELVDSAIALWDYIKTDTTLYEKYKDSLGFLENVSLPIVETKEIQITNNMTSRIYVLPVPPNPLKAEFLAPEMAQTKVYRTLKDEMFTADWRTAEQDIYSITYCKITPDESFQSGMNSSTFKALENAFEEINSNRNEIDRIGNSECLDKYVQFWEEATAYQNIVNEKTVISDDIKALAEEITYGLTSDFDKAMAIQRYFTSGNYTYDLNFKPQETSAEYFIFNSKRGICSDFATAMTLLARSCGLPVRYVEGYTTTETDKENIYEVRGKNAHAFPEVYIAGLGWWIFEPTPSIAIEETIGSTNIFLIYAMYGGIALAVAGIVILIVLILPKLKEKLFCIKAKKLRGNKQLLLVFNKLYIVITKLSVQDNIATSRDIENIAQLQLNTDLHKLCSDYDKAVYGELDMENEDYYPYYQQIMKAVKAKAKADKRKK